MQPQTYESFNAMLQRINRGGNTKVFICGGAVTDYIDHIYNSIFAQYAGPEDYATFYDYDSEGKEVTLSDGRILSTAGAGWFSSPDGLFLVVG